MASLGELYARTRWVLAWELGRSLWFNSRGRVNRNLSAMECQDFAAIVRKRPGRPWNLSDERGRRLVDLLKTAATGRPDPSWNAVGRSLAIALAPRLRDGGLMQRRPAL